MKQSETLKNEDQLIEQGWDDNNGEPIDTIIKAVREIRKQINVLQQTPQIIIGANEVIDE
jgi:hypothetical protein